MSATTRKSVPFESWHVEILQAHGGWSEVGLPKLDPLVLKYLEGKNSWTMMDDGLPVMCGGTIEQWPGRSIAWAYLRRDSGGQMGYITRRAKWIVAQAVGRIECTVRADFPAGQRWVKMLGFEMETPCLRGFGPEGEDHIGYVRFN